MAEMVAVCPVCNGGSIEPVHDFGELPVNSCVQLDSRAEALAYPRGRLILTACLDCGHLFNAAFEPSLVEYSARYEETQSCSPTFRTFHRQLATDLVARHQLHGKRVIEIGCGKGEFLDLLIQAGVGSCQGFDPGFDPARAAFDSDRIEVIRAFYGPENFGLEADFFCCKMTLEHIHAPHNLLAVLRRAATQRPDTGIFFMVPDAGRIVAQGAFEDVYYEHCSYYSPASLATLFTRAGFHVLVMESLFGGQYLGIHARLEVTLLNSVDPMPEVSLPATLSGRLQAGMALWQHHVSSWIAGGQRWAIWGGGSKAVAFLSAIGQDLEPIAVVDINPHRQGAWLPGSGLPVLAPADLTRRQPDHVVIMNAFYQDEIQRTLKQLGLAPAVHCL